MYNHHFERERKKAQSQTLVFERLTLQNTGKISLNAAYNAIKLILNFSTTCTAQT